MFAVLTVKERMHDTKNTQVAHAATHTDMVDSVSREQLTKLADATDAARITLKQVRLAMNQ
jgi:hypothetical protein